MKYVTWKTLLFTVLSLSYAVSDQHSETRASDGHNNNTYQPDKYLAMSLPEISAALQNGEITAEQLVSSYLQRIDKIDRSGPTLQSVLALNPNALADAKALDAKRLAGENLGSLHGIPILLKDNIETKDPIATTAGALALKDNVTHRDSPLVAGLRKAGAIILGKTNLSQWANYRSNNSMSGWTALGGQVRNPHILDRNPCGSSSGSGAAAAASLAAGAVGTETNGSIICPAQINGVVGFKPTVGLVSQQYIIPISASQDTAGPMTKTVTGAAMMLTAMATDTSKAKDYAAALDANTLKGLRIGVLRFSEGDNADIKRQFNAALENMTAAGAILVDITENPIDKPDDFWPLTSKVLRFEFKTGINDYLASTPATVKTRTLAELIAFNKKHADIELALFDQSIFEEAEKTKGIDEPSYAAARDAVQLATRANGIDKLLAQYEVAILVSPSGPLAPRVDPINGDVWPAWAGAGGMAAIAGYPHLTVPMGTVHNLPLGISFMGAKDADAFVLSAGYAYEQNSKLRADPHYLPNAEALKDIAKAMTRK